MNEHGINYGDFIKYVHQHFEHKATGEEIDNILFLKEGYNKDSPTSLGKSLVINRLLFSGKKLGGEAFTYDRPLGKGINLWIADNHKGKSTIFKIVKFALTGTDSIKRDIRPWIEEIFLEFSINTNTYTCFINRTGRDRGGLYRLALSDFLELRELKKLEAIEQDTEFEFRSGIQFEEKIQEFFFDQLSFYTLKYTSKSSSKEDFELNTSHLSWTTYFKSIYLESSNYEYLFFDTEKYGAQGRKIFEMILGLPLTYPINMLTLQLDGISEEIGKIRLRDRTRTETTASEIEKIEKRHSEVLAQLKALQNSELGDFGENAYISEYNTIQTRMNQARRERRIAEDAYQAERTKVSPLEAEVGNLQEDKEKIEAEIARLTKQDYNLDLYRKTESFFTNLEIKTCPHCEIAVSEAKKTKERENHTCSLCGEIPTKQKIEEDELEEKSARIRQEIQSHSRKLEKVRQTYAVKADKLLQARNAAKGLYESVAKLPTLETEQQRLKEIEGLLDAIVSKREAQKKQLEQKEKLVREEAVLKFQLDEFEKERTSKNDSGLTRLLLAKEILEFALEALAKKRITLNKKILEKLQDLIQNEVNSFGLVSITKVEIDDRFNLNLTQNNVVVGFDELEPGEKLRVKLAFYLSLIQLDIEHNLGRHPRFLIFDSPGSEEMVPKHLHGLSDMFQSINERFRDRLQIFVGTALREFANITEPERTFIKGEEEFVF